MWWLSVIETKYFKKCIVCSLMFIGRIRFSGKHFCETSYKTCWKSLEKLEANMVPAKTTRRGLWWSSSLLRASFDRREKVKEFVTIPAQSRLYLQIANWDSTEATKNHHWSTELHSIRLEIKQNKWRFSIEMYLDIGMGR